MGALDCNLRQITLYFDPSSSLGKKTLAIAKCTGLPVWDIDIKKAHFTGTQLVEIANALKIDVMDLVDKYKMKIKFHRSPGKFSEEDWLKILLANPDLLSQPIAKRGDHTILVHTPIDVFQLEQEYIPGG